MLKITFDYDFDNWNKTINKCRSNYYYANKQKQEEMNYVRYEIARQKIKPITKYPIKLECYWHCVSKRSDLDNKSLKSVLDALQQEDILKNDNLTCITEIHHYYVEDTKNMLELILQEL